MTNEALEIRQHVADLINNNPINISNYDWISITNGFEVDEMTAVLIHIAYDDIFEDVANCIIKAWDEALSHKDPKCYYDYTDGIPRAKYRGSHTIKYEIDKIRKVRRLCIDNATQYQENKQNNTTKEKSKDQNARIAELEAQVLQLQEENGHLKEQINNSDDSLLEPMDGVQKLNLHQKIVFFNTVTSVMLDKRYTKLGNYASFIASMCDGNPETIGPMLSRIAKATHPDAEKTENNQRLKTTLNVAAQSVSDMLFQTLTDATKNDDRQVINKIRKHLLLNYPSPEDE